MASKRKIEFGDFQTPLELAKKVVALVKEIYPDPSLNPHAAWVHS